MNFEALKIDGLIDTGALSKTNPDAYLRNIRLLAPHMILNGGFQSQFQFMIANGHLEAPVAKVELQCKIGHITLKEKFKVMTNPTNPLIGLFFLQRNRAILGIHQGILSFSFF